MPAASLRAAAGAVSFLTRIPVGRIVRLDGADVARGAVLFPVVGAGVGALAGAVGALLHLTVPALVAAAITVAVAALVTGGMHLDALADTFDASAAGTREEALAIMRDPRVGSFGAAALALDLLVKAGAIAFLLERGGAFPALVAAGALSRAAALPLAAVLRYPRVERGPGSVLSGRTSPAVAAVGVVVAAGAAVLVAGVDGAWFALGALATTVVLGLVYRAWLGGATGDSLGAATELCEAVVLVVAAGIA
jgi:adenosylcobinamide-GDP ribazoletransferase